MDWMKILQEALPIIVPLGGFTAFLWSSIKGKFEKIEGKLDVIAKDIQGLDRRIQRIEDRLEYSNKVVYVQHEEIKEN